MLPPELLQILACPICKGNLISHVEGPSLRCKPCNRIYPVVEGIPVLLPDHTAAALPSKGEAS